MNYLKYLFLKQKSTIKCSGISQQGFAVALAGGAAMLLNNMYLLYFRIIIIQFFLLSKS